MLLALASFFVPTPLRFSDGTADILTKASTASGTVEKSESFQTCMTSESAVLWAIDQL